MPLIKLISDRVSAVDNTSHSVQDRIRALLELSALKGFVETKGFVEWYFTRCREFAERDIKPIVTKSIAQDAEGQQFLPLGPAGTPVKLPPGFVLISPDVAACPSTPADSPSTPAAGLATPVSPKIQHQVPIDASIVARSEDYWQCDQCGSDNIEFRVAPVLLTTGQQEVKATCLKCHTVQGALLTVAECVELRALGIASPVAYPVDVAQPEKKKRGRKPKINAPESVPLVDKVSQLPVPALQTSTVPSVMAQAAPEAAADHATFLQELTKDLEEKPVVTSKQAQRAAAASPAPAPVSARSSATGGQSPVTSAAPNAPVSGNQSLQKTVEKVVNFEAPVNSSAIFEALQESLKGYDLAKLIHTWEKLTSQTAKADVTEGFLRGDIAKIMSGAVAPVEVAQ
jgi:hypothetical protein